MSNHILVLTGIPASGKSTWAKEQMRKDKSFLRFNRDDARAMINGGLPWIHYKNGNKTAVEDTVTRMRNEFIVAALMKGHNLIIDETNVQSRTFKDVCKLVSSHNFDVLVSEKHFYIDLKTALERDRARTPAVGDSIVEDFFDRFGKYSFQHYKPKSEYFYKLPILTPTKEVLRDAVICDLDGTLALFGGKNAYDRDFENDEINPVVLSILKAHKNYEIIFVSGRHEKAMNATKIFLSRAGFNQENCVLFMRQDGDMRNDAIVKYEIYRDYILDNYNVKFVLDDRDRVVRMWRRMGLTCLQVANGDF